jgi:hypothetical protein
MATIKVYGTGQYWRKGKRYRAIVATTSKLRAMELLRLTASLARDYMSESKNATELEVTKDTLDVVFLTDDMGTSREYVRLEDVIRGLL